MTKGLTARSGWGGEGVKLLSTEQTTTRKKKASFTRIRTFLETLFQGAEESVSK